VANINELNLSPDEEIPIDYENVPEESPGPQPTPQPGRYRFQLPADLASNWNKFQTQKGERVSIVFDSDHQLTIVKSKDDKNVAWVGRAFNTRVTNAERPRRVRGTKDRVLVPDMTYMLQNGLKSKARPRTNLEFINEMKRYGGKQFEADIEFTAYCDPKREIWAYDSEGTLAQVNGTVGCGKRFYQSQIPRESDGKYAERVGCPCGAVIRCFGNLANFGPAE
jgi:hypothetical protein